MRKFEAINLMKLYSMGSASGWNEFLQECTDSLDINQLAKVKYQIACGMDDLAKQKLNTDDINVWFIRMTRSLELTAKRIIKIKHPMPGDNPLLIKGQPLDALVVKRKRDRELATFLKESAY